MIFRRLFFLTLAVAGSGSGFAAASGPQTDSGMWPVDSLPSALLRHEYGFAPDSSWLDHVRKATVRFDNGGTGAIVSPDGLLLTNQHVVRAAIEKLNQESRDYVRDGFHARTRAE